MTPLPDPELLTTKQAAQLIKIHPSTLRNWERAGKIPAIKIGRRRDRLYLKSQVYKAGKAAV